MEECPEKAPSSKQLNGTHGPTEPATTLAWSNVTYDIPSSKKQRPRRRIFGRSGEQASDDVEDPPISSNSNDDDDDAVESTASHRRILHSVTGSIKKGQVVAILGASGAGKTTLLNILSARLGRVGTLTGSVTFHGQPRDARSWKRTVGFVEQDDIMLGLFTVQETLQYASQMRLPDSMYSQEDRQQRVREAIDMLRLHDCKDTRIGSSAVRGISGGERKRTSIGMELISDVDLLLLDEPTSGLDAYAAYSVVENLCYAARQRQLSCLMTIHQPSWAVLNLVDSVQLLAQGQVYYEGPPGGMKAWFEQLGYIVPEGANPADYYVTIAENPKGDAQGKLRVKQIIQAWKQHSNELVHTTPAEGKNDKERLEDHQTQRKTTYTHWPRSWLAEVGMLTSRNARMTMRDKDTNWGVVVQTVVLLILIGFAFFRLGHKQNDVLARIGVLFFVGIVGTVAEKRTKRSKQSFPRSSS